ncbi:MAG: hypothetical protein PHO15_06375 [Eubacteriales bacterium]|nr:hypothetical protein [Eubacteriales bacterium]
MKERLKRRQLSAVVGVLTIVALFVGIFILHLIMRYLSYAFNASFLEYIEYALFIFIGVLIIRKWVTEYEYAVIDGELFVDRYLGKRPRRLFQVKLCDIEYIGNQLPTGFKGKKQRLTYLSKRSGVVYIVYENNKKCVYFSPSQKMLDFIDVRRPKKN